VNPVCYQIALSSPTVLTYEMKMLARAYMPFIVNYITGDRHFFPIY